MRFFVCFFWLGWCNQSLIYFSNYSAQSSYMQARVFTERINQELDYFKTIGYSEIIFTNTQMS